ncbi:MAG: Maf family protein [Betaproteobacteria bacterium]|nr:Maf family protein [Betaproteobacteria bacterium]
MNKFPPRIYLASRSPRRRELLDQIGVAHDVLNTDIDESALPGETPSSYVLRIATAKAYTGWQAMLTLGLPRLPVLAADTCVTLDGEIFGKPGNPQVASAMLRRLSGRSHQVLTAIALYTGSHCFSAVSTSTVSFRSLDENDIAHYIASGEPLDKAGSYAIQGLAAQFICHLDGSYSGVMGLPVFETTQLLEQVWYQRHNN